MAKTPIQSTELIPNTFKALAVPAQQLATMLRQNIGNQALKPTDLDRVKVPAGGGVAWEVPSLKGPESTQVLEGIILFFKDVRAYWKTKGGTNSPPDCQSNDGVIGIGAPGGDCAVCPLAQFGTATDEKGQPAKGQACKQMRMMLFLRQDDVIPLLISLPPTSLQPARKFFLRLAGNGLPYYAITTQLRLEKAKNTAGTIYSQVSMSMGRQLEKEEVEKVLLVAQAMQQLFAGMTIDAHDAGHE